MLPSGFRGVYAPARRLFVAQMTFVGDWAPLALPFLLAHYVCIRHTPLFLGCIPICPYWPPASVFADPGSVLVACAEFFRFARLFWFPKVGGCGGWEGDGEGLRPNKTLSIVAGGMVLLR